MNARNAPLRFARRMGEHFPCPEYANPIEAPAPRSMLASPWFWLSGLASVGVWTLIWAAIAWMLENAK